MGIFDAVKNRLGRGNEDEYLDDDQYYQDEEYYEGEYEEGYADDAYYDEPGGESSAASNRQSSVFNDFTPLVSMSDVRSQELPRYAPSSTSTRTSGQQTQIKTSLPYIGDTSGSFSQRQSHRSEAHTGELSSIRHAEAEQLYGENESADPLLRRHSLSNTGDFAATSPSYYASRSGVGHVRPAGQPRRTHKFREAIVINPNDYSDAEQVATNLRRGNAVVLVLTQTRPELAKRILDFSFGAAAVAEGQVASIGERIYALTCEYPLTDTELELLRNRGIL